MIGPVAGLINRQRTPHQRLRLQQAVGVLQQQRQVVERCGRGGMLWPQPVFTLLQTLLVPAQCLPKGATMHS